MVPGGIFHKPKTNRPSVLLTLKWRPLRLTVVAEYSQFLGCKVTVRYRVGEILLSATGTFSADSGRSIFLEQHMEQHGARKYFRWEIPYPYVYRIETERQAETQAGSSAEPEREILRKAAAAGTGGSRANTTAVTPFPQRPKTA
jgi:hypothetical protein